MVIETLNMTKKIVDFFNEYPDVFMDMEKKTIINYSKKFSKYLLVPDNVREVYDELELIPDENNIYLGFIDLVEKIHSLENKKIVEIGGGVLPRLAKRITGSKKIKEMVVYDPRLSKYEEDTDKLRLVRKRFDINTSLDGADLILGLMPCEAANVIVDSAVKNRTDFVLALCEGGPHGDEFDYFEDEREWLDDIIKSASLDVEQSDMGKLKIKYMREYGNPYPVIFNDRG